MLYTPPAFRMEARAALHDHIARSGLATLVTAGPDGPLASHLPLLLDPEAGGEGALIGHLARANPQAALAGEGAAALAIFHGPDAYVSPSWYASKREHGRVVPTWNYAVVHARGRLCFFDDPDRLAAAVDRLTRRHEAGFAEPWAVSDAPAPFIAAQLRAIVGVELRIERLEGKLKLSQNRPEADRAGVRAGLAARDEPGAAATAALMEREEARRS